MRLVSLLMAMMAPLTIVWKDKTPMPRAEGGAATALVGDDLVLAGGTNWEGGVKQWMRDVQIYDVKTDRWRNGPALPAALAYGPAIVTSNGMEVLGGSDAQHSYRDIWRMDRAAQRWVQEGTTPQYTQLGRAVSFGEEVFLFGGCQDVADLTRCSADVYSRSGGKWRRRSVLPSGPVAMEGIAVARSKIYLFGGCSMPSAGNLINRADAWEYDPKSDGWRRLHDLPKANRALSAVAVDDRYIYLFCGYNASAAEAKDKGPAFGFSNEVWVYDIEINNYTPSTPAPVAVAGTDFFLHGRTFYGAGGEDRMKGRVNRIVAGELKGSR